MGKVNYNADEAIRALNQSLEADEEMQTKFKELDALMANSFGNSGDVVTGGLGETIGNSFADSVGSSYSKNLKVKTEQFFRETVPEFLNKMDEFNNKTTSIYANAAQNDGEIEQL